MAGLLPASLPLDDRMAIVEAFIVLGSERDEARHQRDEARDDAVESGKLAAGLLDDLRARAAQRPGGRGRASGRASLMATTSSIEWTDATWNPITGCDRVSPGCDHCYALTLAKRLKAMGNPRYQNDGKPPTSGPGFGVTLHHDLLDLPRRWRKSRRVFVNSMSDLFHARVPSDFTARVFDVMAATPQHTYQVLTKRPERMRRFVERWVDGWAMPAHIWLGTSVEDQKRAEQRIPELVRTPAVVRFLSCEPLLGPLDIAEHLGWQWARAYAHSTKYPRHILGPVEEPDGGWRGHMECVDDGMSEDYWDGRGCGFATAETGGITWVIVGGESGPKARSMDPAWAHSLVGQCRDQGAAVFVKQMGAAWSSANGHGWTHGGDSEQWPEDLRVREYPQEARRQRQEREGGY